LKENFDRFNFAIYKEKEMADFRRWMTALAMMALFVGLACAQGGGVGTGGSSFSSLTCSVANVGVTPSLRTEGFTEQTGDIVLICTGGTPLPAGSLIPTANITVYYNATVTSRLINNSSSLASSEALLLIDEPNNGAAGSQNGYGPSLPQIVCTSPANGAGPNGCPEWVGTVSSFGSVPATSGVAVSGSAAGTAPGANVFQGVVSGTSVTFQGVPILPPVSSGISRVFRITNVRVNANGISGGSAAGTQPVYASISISGATSLPISNPTPIVGYVTSGLSTSVSSAANFSQCNATTSLAAVLNFSEKFGTAFKTRVDGLRGGNVSNTSSSPTQNVPGSTYNSESNFVLNGNGAGNGTNGAITSGSVTAGLADYGTRLKAVFSNVPAGTTVYVSMNNVTTGGVQNQPVPVGNTTGSSYAVLLTSESTSDLGGVPAATFTNSFTATSSSGSPTSAVYYQAFTSQGSPVAVTWEVVNTQPTVIETMSFAVYFQYANVTQTFPPAPTTATVNMSFAPNPTNGAFSASNGGTTAVNTLIPRFADTSGAGSTLFSISQCQTTLLFPYVTTVTGFTTGIVIANTTTDPFSSTNQSGTCTLNWYQGANNPVASITSIIPTGTIFTQDVSATGFAGPGFSGYMIALCNFQLAHGVAQVTDIGSQHILSTYLALVVTTGTGKRTPPPTGGENLNN